MPEELGAFSPDCRIAYSLNCIMDLTQLGNELIAPLIVFALLEKQSFGDFVVFLFHRGVALTQAFRFVVQKSLRAAASLWFHLLRPCRRRRLVLEKIVGLMGNQRLNCICFLLA